MDLRLLLRLKLRESAIDFGLGEGVLTEQMVIFKLPDDRPINEPMLHRAIQDATDDLLGAVIEVTVDRLPNTETEVKP